MITIPNQLKSSGPQIGRPVSRVDGRAKVTGTAKYVAEFNASDLVYGVVVSSAIAKGRITEIDASDALKLPGVLQVFTHENRPHVARLDRSWRDDDTPGGSPFRPLYDDRIVYSGQPVALVVAETFEIAQYAASLVRVRYKTDAQETDFLAQRSKAYHPSTDKDGFKPPPKPRGNPDAALEAAAVKVEAEYFSPVEHHNPMECHASTVLYDEDGTLTIYDKIQGAQSSQKYICGVFSLPKTLVRVLSLFVGGAFGSGLRPQYQLFMAVMAALELKRSVRVSLTRPQMFTFGHRPETVQHVALGASPDGKLQAIIHEATGQTSRFEDYTEIVVNWSGLLYQCDNVRLDYKVAQIDTYTPLDMRAPGAVLGLYALESAMDELAAKLEIDPIELRLRNFAEKNQNDDTPFSSNELRACYSQGAQRFGWSKRHPKPRSMRDGRHLIGWGMATGIWDAMQGEASARAILSIDGKLSVSSATADIGTGTYTIMTQIAADRLGLPIENVTFKLGDSSLPTAPLEGGSWTASSVGSAVLAVCDKIRDQLIKLARKMQGSPLSGAQADDITLEDGQIRLISDPLRSVSITEAMRSASMLHIEQEMASLPNYAKQSRYTINTRSAVFVEVKVDEDLGTIGVSRVVSAIAGGRILNPKTAASQISGAVVWGIGMALEEETLMDTKLGRFMNHDLAEYHVPVHADIGSIDVIFVEEHDEIVNPLGAKGLGEIGIVGVAAAVANAVYHATGKRVRDLPITLDKLM